MTIANRRAHLFRVLPVFAGAPCFSEVLIAGPAIERRAGRGGGSGGPADSAERRPTGRHSVGVETFNPSFDDKKKKSRLFALILSSMRINEYLMSFS